MPAKQDVLAFDGWPKGVNLVADPSLLDPQELSEGTNVVLGPKGELRQRSGMDAFDVFTDAAKYDSIEPWNIKLDWITEGGGDPPVFAKHAFFARKVSNGDVYIVIEYDGARVEQKVEASGLASVTDRNFKLAVMNAKTYITGPGSTPHEINGAAVPVTRTNLTGWTSAPSHSGTEFPRARELLVAYDRVFAIPDSNRNRLHFSDLLLPKTWQTTNYIDISPDDRQIVTALKLFADQMIIFKENSMWGLAGKDFSSLSGLELYQIDAATGTTAPRTITPVGSFLGFMDPSRGVFLFDGSALHNIGDPVFEYMKANWNLDNIENAHGWFWDDRYHLSIPMGANTDPSMTFVFDLAHKAWTVWDRGWSDVCVVGEYNTATGVKKNDTHLIGVRGPTEAMSFDGFMEIGEDFLTDDGSDIDVSIKTGWLSPSGSFARHRVKQTVIHMDDTEATTTLSADTAYDTGTPEATVSFDPSGEEDGAAWRTHALNGFRWRELRLSVDATVTSSVTKAFQLNSIKLLVSVLEQTRGQNITVV